ncbi:hypothetical protein CL653_00825 [bacterium]|nr:hypothetical protein [bacterium]
MLLAVFLLGVLPFSVEAGWLQALLGGADGTNRQISFLEDPSELKILTAANAADPKAAIGGGDLLIVDGALVSHGQAGDDYVTPDSTQGEISLYIVREGDTLSQIAEMFDVTSNTILWANDLGGPTDIHPGDTLIILPIVGVQHVIKSGDTLTAIAKKYGGNEEEITGYNRIASLEDLSIGDTLVIPGGNMHTSSSSNVASVQSGSTSTNFVNPVGGYYVRTQGVHGYNAVDLAAKLGTPILAAAGGEVIISKISGWNSGYGQYIVVRHGDGTQTLYAHLSKNAVGVGEYVGAGEVVGYMGSTGKSTGVHLHFEVRGGRNPF